MKHFAKLCTLVLAFFCVSQIAQAENIEKTALAKQYNLAEGKKVGPALAIVRCISNLVALITAWPGTTVPASSRRARSQWQRLKGGRDGAWGVGRGAWGERQDAAAPGRRSALRGEFSLLISSRLQDKRFVITNRISAFQLFSICLRGSRQGVGVGFNWSIRDKRRMRKSPEVATALRCSPVTRSE